jgi:predicted enzyme related to lactoylglutathione lyase
MQAGDLCDAVHHRNRSSDRPILDNDGRGIRSLRLRLAIVADDSANCPESRANMDMKLEVVPLPVSDVDRSLTFYTQNTGFTLDHDVSPGNGMRIIQLTPPGSACSIVFGTGMGETGVAPGSIKGLHLVVADIEEARDQLVERGVTVSEVSDLGGVLYAYFEDPDANTWALQEIRTTFR